MGNLTMKQIVQCLIKYLDYKYKQCKDTGQVLGKIYMCNIYVLIKTPNYQTTIYCLYLNGLKTAKTSHNAK